MPDPEDQESLAIVDKQDKVIGSIQRKELLAANLPQGHYIRFVEVFIQRSNGDIYLPRRSVNKKIAPGGLDLSAAGHILSDESYLQAAVREIQEETGILADQSDLRFIAKINPLLALPYFRELYLLRTDETPRLSSEHTEATWVAPKSLTDTIQNDIPTKETLIEDIPVLLDYLRNEKV